MSRNREGEAIHSDRAAEVSSGRSSRASDEGITRSPLPTLTHSIFLDSSTDWRNPLNRRMRTRISAGVAGESG